MKKLLLILSILLCNLCYIGYSVDCFNDADVGCTLQGCTSSNSLSGCSCDAEASPDVMFSVSVHRSVPEGITWDVEKDFLQKIAGAGIVEGGGFGLQIFATKVEEIVALSDVASDGSAIEDYFDDITIPGTDTSPTSTNNYYGNDLLLAMQTMNTAMEGRDSANQKIHIVVLNYDPKYGADGTNTQTTSMVDPCSAGIESKRNNVRNYVLAIGTDGVDFHKEFFECIVEDTDNDIIVVDPDSPSTSIDDILDKICVTDYQFKITEVKPSNAAHEGGTQTTRFIEGYNFGKEIASGELTVTWSEGGSTAMNNVAIPQGEFFTFYHAADSGTAPSGSYSFTLDFGTGTDTQTAWKAEAKETGNDNVIDTVEYTSTADGWSEVPDGFSYELRATTMQSGAGYGANWRASCTIGGTGGLSPGDNEEYANAQWQCTSDATNDPCDATTTDPCDIGGYSGTCLSDGSACDCATGWGDTVECRDVLVPTGTCTADIIKEKVGAVYQDVLILTWDKINYDGPVKYSVDYESESMGTLSADVGKVNAWATTDFLAYSSSTSYATIYTEFTNNDGTPYSGTSSIECFAETTDPTKAPTTQPTDDPTTDPTVIPTPQPTFEEPACYLYGDFCGIRRCDCFGEERSCCSPESECDRNVKVIDVTADAEDYESYVYFRMYPYEWDFETLVYFQIEQFGTVNKSEFIGTDDSDTDTTTRRRRMILQRQRRRSRFLLQSNMTNMTDTANMTTTFLSSTEEPQTTVFLNESENKLQITMEPLGIGMVSLNNLDDSYLEANVTLLSNQGSIVCEQGAADCLTSDECEQYAAYYTLSIINCSTDNTQDTPTDDDPCAAIYPSVIDILVARGDCDVIFAGNNDDGALPDWWWIILLILIVFLLCLAWLVYRFWWKQKKSAAELGDAEEELDQQIADNQAGFGRDLDTGDVAFNPMATGVPGMNRPADAFGNEIHERQQHAQNEMVNVNAEVFQVREEMGQNTGNQRNNQMGGY